MDEVSTRWHLPGELGQDLAKLTLFDMILYIDNSASVEFAEGGVLLEEAGLESGTVILLTSLLLVPKMKNPVEAVDMALFSFTFIPVSEFDITLRDNHPYARPEFPSLAFFWPLQCTLEPPNARKRPYCRCNFPFN